MENREEPEILYKYFSVSNDVLLKRVENLICKRQIYFAKPSQFNDPFDSKCKVIVKGNARELRTIVERSLNTIAKGLSKKDKAKIAKQRFEQVKNGFAFDVQSHLDEMGVLCLSEINNSILMWGHYADSHRGVCCGFDADSTQEYFGSALQITYSHKYPIIEYLKKTKEDAADALLTKSKLWEYEKEWRIIDYDYGAGIKIYPKERLREIIFGCRINSDTRLKIINWVNENSMDVCYFQANQSNDHYALDLVPYGPNKE